MFYIFTYLLIRLKKLTTANKTKQTNTVELYQSFNHPSHRSHSAYSTKFHNS